MEGEGVIVGPVGVGRGGRAVNGTLWEKVKGGALQRSGTISSWSEVDFGTIWSEERKRGYRKVKNDHHPHVVYLRADRSSMGVTTFPLMMIMMNDRLNAFRKLRHHFQ